jgi:hypothetical protein
MSLEKMRKQLSAENAELAAQPVKPPADKSIYVHWEMAPIATATLRFLLDGNTDNILFWAKCDDIKLYFEGIKDKPKVGHIQVQVPCIEKFEKECPLLQEVRT